MKQIIQDMKNGQTLLEDVPCPKVKHGSVLIQTTRSLVSLGTERMLVEFGKASLVQKARQQPDKVKMVLDKIKSDGLMPTLDAVFTKLGAPLPLGYCNVGRVVEVGKGVSGFKVGDRVASNGHHAEFVCIPKNLVAKIPDNVTDEEASFTVIGAIGLQGVRLLKSTFGETIVVVGLGLIGLMTAELLKANGCNVIGFDFDESKVNLAIQKGIDAINPGDGTDQVKYVLDKTDGIGSDGVIITASSKGDEIISQSANMCRKLGRVILVGVVGLNLNRNDFYNKEITFQVSCSYGPGRYDDNYEIKGQDYPIAYVRWTEKRNFEAVLNAIANKSISVKELITENIKLEEYRQVYGNMRKSGSIASILEYRESPDRNSIVDLSSSFEGSNNGIGIIGAGNFTSSTLLPAFKNLDANIEYIASSGGLTAKTLAQKILAKRATSDYKEILKDSSVDLVVITTRHDLHAQMTIEALEAGKNVFVEKPLCLNNDDLHKISEVRSQSGKNVIVGFNRRFAPLAQKMKSLAGVGPKNIIATMNAGFIPSDSWVHDMEVGGGRILGEACHFIDLCSYMADSNVIEVCMNALGSNPQGNTDNATILLRYENGTNAVINYFANGAKSYSKERIEIYSQEKTLVLDNWRELKGYGFKNFKKEKSKQNKGHKNQFSLLVNLVNKGGEPLIPFDSIMNTSKASFAAIESLEKGSWIAL